MSFSESVLASNSRLTADQSARRENPREYWLPAIRSVPIVCRISGAGIPKAALKFVWIVNDKGRYHSRCSPEI